MPPPHGARITIGTPNRTVRPVAHPGGLRDDLVERGMDEVGELDLGDRQQSVQGHPDRHADDPGLGQRGVHHAILTELVEEPLGDLEHAPSAADVFTEEDDTVIRGHLVVQRVADRRDDVLLGHSISARTCRSHGPWIRVGSLPGGRDRGLDLGAQLLVDGVDGVVVEQPFVDQTGP